MLDRAAASAARAPPDERPRRRLPARLQRSGFVFVPCAGPVLAFATSSAATTRLRLRDGRCSTFAYALGAACPMLAIAIGGQRVLASLRARRQSAAASPSASSSRLATLAIVFNVDTQLQTWLPGYTDALQQKPVERSSGAKRELATLTTSARRARSRAWPRRRAARLRTGAAVPRRSSSGSTRKPLTLAALRGKVVLDRLLDVLLHQLPAHAAAPEAWADVPQGRARDRRRAHARVRVRARRRRTCATPCSGSGSSYPVALDNDFGTWNAYQNQYWPAKYLIDRNGHVRHAHFGEGEYDKTEQLIRRLLGEQPGAPAGRVAAVATRRRPGRDTGVYLGYQRLERYAGSKIQPGTRRVRPSAGARAERARLRRPLARRAPSASWPGTAAALRLHYFARRTSSSCSAARAACRCWSTGSRSGRST